MEDEKPDLLQSTTNGADPFGEGLRKKEKKANENAAADENRLHTSHLHHSARTSPTKVATIAPMPIKKPIK